MKLKEEQIKEIIAKAYKDLRIDCDDRFPIKVHFHSKEDKNNRHKKDYWSGRYDYSKPLAGVEITRTYPYDSMSVDDEKGVAFAVLFFPEDSPIKLDENGKYVWAK